MEFGILLSCLMVQKPLDVNGSSRQRRIHWATMKGIKQDLLLKDSLRRNESITRRLFFLILKKDSFCIIMTLVAHFDLGLQQIDVKIAFLSGNLEEEVYMKQLKGFPLVVVSIWYVSLRNPYMD